MNLICYLWKKGLRNYRDYGIAIFLKKLILYMCYPVYRNKTYVIYSVDLTQFNNNKITSQSKDFVYRFVETHETDLMDQVDNMEEWIGIRSKLKQGNKCLVCLRDGAVTGFNLIALDTMDIPLIRFKKKLRGGQCFSIQISVHPEHRSCGIGTSLRRELFSRMKTMGYTRLYGGTQLSNKSNRRLSQKVGLREFAFIKYQYFLGFARHKITRIKNVTENA
ncbi:hypothetical protein CHISP_1705 [Chitinispirillum alkaliphilum]|nr:hypothetical protein CHISP_1705 [Chitinispirillum alkaliphilum]